MSERKDRLVENQKKRLAALMASFVLITSLLVSQPAAAAISCSLFHMSYSELINSTQARSQAYAWSNCDGTTEIEIHVRLAVTSNGVDPGAFVVAQNVRSCYGTGCDVTAPSGIGYGPIPRTWWTHSNAQVFWRDDDGSVKYILYGGWNCHTIEGGMGPQGVTRGALLAMHISDGAGGAPVGKLCSATIRVG